MTFKNIKVWARQGPYASSIDILVAQHDVDGARVAMATPVTMVPCGDESVLEPTLKISNQAAQQLMDELWQCGLRPTEGTGSAGSLRATQAHLEDMRRLVFKGQ